jgi:hypothetical protein
MAVESITVGDLVSRVSFVLTNDTTAPSGLTTDIKWALDAALDEFANKYDLPQFRAEDTVSWVADQKDYALPDDFRRIVEPSLRYTDGPKYTLSYVELQEWDRLEADRFANDQSRPRFYTIMGADATTGALQIRPLPTPKRRGGPELCLHLEADPDQLCFGRHSCGPALPDAPLPRPGRDGGDKVPAVCEPRQIGDGRSERCSCPPRPGAHCSPGHRQRPRPEELRVSRHSAVHPELTGWH